ncbi:MAG: V-type ATP synthase subunit B [Promethearchaeota archaeon]
MADERAATLKPTYQTVSTVSGPLLILEKVRDVAYGELVEVTCPDGTTRRGTILEAMRGRAIVQIFEGTRGLDTKETRVRLTGETMHTPVTQDLLGRVLNGSGQPIDQGPPIVPDLELDINGSPMNPDARQYPREFIQTGLSVIDGLNTLVRGQKLPIFSGSGLPHDRVAAQITRQATIPGKAEEFAVILCAIGITAETAQFYRKSLEETGALATSVLVLNLADDPPVERIISPRTALTIAEYLAFEQGMHVLVILTDMLNYANALREISAAREEVPGRRGYPGYLYTDLASIYERAGRIIGRKGTITQMPILSMPGDDITHPVADLSGYITEGQLITSRSLHNKGVYPPIDPAPSLSRLMKEGIGKGLTREDHNEVQAQLYYGYAEGRDLRDLVAVVGEGALSERDQVYLKFLEDFEERFLSQGEFEERSIEQTLDLGWDLLSVFPERELKRIDPDTIAKASKDGKYRYTAPTVN